MPANTRLVSMFSFTSHPFSLKKSQGFYLFLSHVHIPVHENKPFAAVITVTNVAWLLVHSGSITISY